MLRTDANPEGLPIDVFDGIRDGVASDRSQFFRELSGPFYGANRDGSTVTQGTRDEFWLWGMSVGIKGAYDCVKAFSETDLTEDLKKIDVPTLIVHGDDDQIVPIVASGDKSSKLVKGAVYKIYRVRPTASPWCRSSPRRSTPTCSPLPAAEPPLRPGARPRAAGGRPSVVRGLYTTSRCYPSCPASGSGRRRRYADWASTM
ncbi:hypothetical protein GCM10025734_08440 [Kitasatospora paranensis]